MSRLLQIAFNGLLYPFLGSSECMHRDHDSRHYFRRADTYRSLEHKKRKRARSSASESDASDVSSITSPKHLRKHRDRHRRSSLDHTTDDVQRSKERNRRRVKHRSRMWTIVDDSDDAQVPSRHCKDRSYSRSSDSHSNESVERDLKRRGERVEDKTVKTFKNAHKKKKKKKKKSAARTSFAVNQNEYGKYGIIRECDYQAKCVSFQAWLRDIKKVGLTNHMN